MRGCIYTWDVRRLTTLFSISEANRSIDWEQRVGPYFIVAGQRVSERGGVSTHIRPASAFIERTRLSLSLISPKSKRTHTRAQAPRKKPQYVRQINLLDRIAARVRN